MTVPRKKETPVHDGAAEWTAPGGHVYRGSIMEIIYQCQSIEELVAVEKTILRGIMSGVLQPTHKTKVRWVKAIKARLTEVGKPVLYGPGGDKL